MYETRICKNCGEGFTATEDCEETECGSCAVRTEFLILAKNGTTEHTYKFSKQGKWLENLTTGSFFQRIPSLRRAHRGLHAAYGPKATVVNL